MQLYPDTILQGRKYRIIRTLGQGGFGITYEAEQINLDRKVAIKEFFMRDCCGRDKNNMSVIVETNAQRQLVNKFRKKFIKEAQTIAGFTHQHIVRILDVFEENRTAYYVMEILPGGSLSDLLCKSGPLPENSAIRYIRQIASALRYIHEHNTVHLDVKPSNILLNSMGEAVLVDFGTSKHYDSAGEQTSTTPIGYSKGYAPLEQYRDGDVSQFKPATDIYALGATLYTLVTGQVPPEASVVYEDGLAFVSGISDSLWQVIRKSMMPKRKDRPQTIDEFLSLIGPEAEDTVGIHSPFSGENEQMERVQEDSFEYLTSSGNIRVYHGHCKKWLAICDTQISEYYDDVIVNTLVDDCIVCTKRNGYYAYTYIDVGNRCVKSTLHKYLYANVLSGNLNYYRDAPVFCLIDKPNNYYDAIIENSTKESMVLLMLKRKEGSYFIDEQEFNYYPKTEDKEEFWILLSGYIIGFPIVGLVAAGVFHFSLMIGVLLGLVLGAAIIVANKKDCVKEAQVKAIGTYSTVLGTKTETTEYNGAIKDCIWPLPGSPNPNGNLRVKRRDLATVKAMVYKMDNAPSCDSSKEIVCSLTDAQGYYRIERNGFIGMRHLMDDGSIQELFPFDGEDDTDFEDAWLRLHSRGDQ